MDCAAYIEKYLSAHVDGELSADELRAVEEHLAGCVNCRARFAEERAVKALLRERAELRRTPPIVRGSILAALDAIDAADASNTGRGRDRSAGADRGPWYSIRRARVWMPASMAAVAVFAFVMLHGGNPPPAHAVPPFDIAIQHYEHFTKRFEPNVKSTTPAEISDAYIDHQLPGYLWNFQQRGYKLIGGRIDHLQDGSSVSYTFYRGDTGTILCTYMKSHGLRPPDGELREIGGHHYYQYNGYSICLSYPHGGFICILVSRRSMKEFVRDIVDSEP
ncbi:MAG: anti-sigma factor family protein [Candidatus Binatus sp.]